MFYNLRELWEKYLRKQAQKPIPFLIIRYVVIWVILCLVLTNEMGEIYFQRKVRDFETTETEYIQQKLEDLKKKEREGHFGEGDQALIEYSKQALNAYFANCFKTEVKTVTFILDDILAEEEEQEELAFLIVGEEGDDQERLYYSCPVNKLIKVKEATLDIKKNSTTAWHEITRQFFELKVPYFGLDLYVGWRFKLIDGYLKNDSTEFRPGTVLAKYMIAGSVAEEFTISCGGSYDENQFTYVSDFGNNEILFVEDVDNWKNVNSKELRTMEVSIKGRTWISPVYILYSIYDEGDFGSYATLVEKYVYDRYNTYRVPFSFLSGNLAFQYCERIYDSTGESFRIDFMGYAPGGFKKYIPDFFSSMMIYYFLLLLIMAFLAWLRYQQLYSLRARTGFHKTLVNSMAHDLKTPLMVMQGFGENLKENVHTEKREYYADQILENVAYLNGLVNKNLDLAKKRDGELLDVEAMYLMDLVAETKERYQEKLDEKKLQLELRGETLLHGDPKLVRVVIDNLISNAIKYSPEGSTINVYGTHNAFTVSNKAMLRYKKNINHLLEPLEMGEESRTAGMGTGLGLSIANGIVAEHGWKMRLYYNKKTKIFTVKIRPHR